MPYQLDSDWVIDYLADLADARRLIERLAPSGLVISIVTYMEVHEGVSEQADPVTARLKLDSFLRGVVLLPLSPAVVRRCADLRRHLRRQGRRVRPRALDLIIAATAIEHDLTFVTRNVGDYRDIPGLKLL